MSAIASTVEALNAAWTRWYAFLKDHSPQQAEQRRAIYTRLLRFSDRHLDEVGHVETILAGLSKGKHLVEAAVRWEDAVAGVRPGSEGTPTDRARGEQFRLVMARGGLETILHALLPVEEQNWHGEAELRGFLERCGLGRYEPLAPPRRELVELGKWLQSEEQGGTHPLTAFLKLNKNDAKRIRAWLLDGKPVEDWYDALQLGRVLRNSTVHGSLSATKVCRWRLRPAFVTLGTNIGDVVVAALEQLAG